MDNLFDSFHRNALSLGIDGLLSSADVIAVGFSGGADSTVLLHLLRRFYADAEICAIHVNHKIRGKSADEDEEHCRRVCEELGIPFILRVFDVPAQAEQLGMGLEEAARQARYSAFDEYIRSRELEGKRVLVATAHNADDNLETMVFNLIRGSGSRGLGGISPIRGNYVRPLLCYTSAEIRDFCGENGFDFVIDETNGDTKYSRNLIRSEVVPHLRSISPSCAGAALSASFLLRRDDEYLTSVAVHALGGSRTTSASVEILRDMDDCVLSRALLVMYENSRGGRKDFGSRHLDACIRLIRTSDSGRLSLPGKMCMILEGGEVCFVPQEKECVGDFFRVLLEPGEDIRGKIHFFPFPEAKFTVVISDAALDVPKISPNDENIYKISIHTTIRSDKICGSVFLRNRLPGDRIVMGGMTRRLKKLFNSSHTKNRDLVPIFCDDSGIFYVPEIGKRDSLAEGDIRISYWR